MSHSYNPWTQYGSTEFEADEALEDSLRNDYDAISPRCTTNRPPRYFGLPELTTLNSLHPYDQPRSFDTIDPYDTVMQDGNILQSVSEAVSDEDLQWAMILQQCLDIGNEGQLYQYPDPEVCSMYKHEEDERPTRTPIYPQQRAQPPSSSSLPPFSQHRYDDGTSQQNYTRPSPSPSPRPSTTISYQFLRPQDVDVADDSPLRSLPAPILSPPQTQQQPHRQVPAIPTTYAGRRNADARQDYPWECGTCGRRFLYTDSAFKHHRKHHGEPATVIKRYDAPKRPQPGLPRNSRNAQAQAQRGGRRAATRRGGAIAQLSPVKEEEEDAQEE